MTQLRVTVEVPVPKGTDPEEYAERVASWSLATLQQGSIASVEAGPSVYERLADLWDQDAVEAAEQHPVVAFHYAALATELRHVHETQELIV